MWVEKGTFYFFVSMRMPQKSRMSPFPPVVPADRKLGSHAVRHAKGWRKRRFARRAEVLELTGVTPGSIPPFGSLFGLKTFCDDRLALNETINFNAGDHGISVAMAYVDYVRLENPEPGTFAE